MRERRTAPLSGRVCDVAGLNMAGVHRYEQALEEANPDAVLHRRMRDVSPETRARNAEVLRRLAEENKEEIEAWFTDYLKKVGSSREEYDAFWKKGESNGDGGNG